MLALKPRVRLVSCRLTEDEYRALYKHCITAGSSSISGFVRDALRARIGEQATPAASTGTLDAHSHAIESILAEMAELKKRIAEASLERLGTVRDEAQSKR